MVSQCLKLFLAATCLVIFTETFAQKSNSPDLIGMAQVSRSDGLLAFVLLGAFSDRNVCVRELQSFTDGFVQAGKDAGFSATIDFAACDQQAQKGTEFEALRKGTPTSHYVFFTPSLRMMLVHERGSLEYERQICDYWRGQFLSKLQISAKCLAPLERWQKKP